MHVDLNGFQPSLSDTDLELQFPDVERASPRRPIDGPSATVDDDGGEPELPLAAPTPSVPWMEARLGGHAAMGAAEDYLPTLMALHEHLSSRQDVVAQYGSAAILDEMRNHLVLNSHRNSLIA